MPYNNGMSISLRELFNLIEMIPEAGLQYIVNRMVPPENLTKDECKTLTAWITKGQKADRSDIIREILYLMDIENIRYVANPTENECLKIVYVNPLLIEFIDEPSVNVQMAAVNNQQMSPGRLFNLIKNPSPPVFLAVVNEKPRSILTMNNPTEELQIAAILKMPYLIQESVVAWTPTARSLAFDLDVKLFASLSDPTEEQCWAALHDDHNNIRHIKDPLPEMKAFSILVS